MERPTNKTVELAQEWHRSNINLERCRAALDTAIREHSEAENHIGQWLAPKDAEVGEVFYIWFGDGLLRITVIAQDSYKVSWRTPMSPKVATEFHM